MKLLTLSLPNAPSVTMLKATTFLFMSLSLSLFLPQTRRSASVIAALGWVQTTPFVRKRPSQAHSVRLSAGVLRAMIWSRSRPPQLVRNEKTVHRLCNKNCKLCTLQQHLSTLLWRHIYSFNIFIRLNPATYLLSFQCCFNLKPRLK